jgi:NlpC/P60 family putative phage cell wall peptidase
MSAAQRAAVIAEAHTWLNTPYHHMGRIKGVGVDCATLLCEVYAAVGVTPHVDPGHYPNDWHLHRSDERYLGWLRKYGREVAEPQPGDVIVWRFGRCFSHGAILCDNGQIIHSYLGEGVRLERRDAEIFREPSGEWRAVKYFTLWDDNVG